MAALLKANPEERRMTLPRRWRASPTSGESPQRPLQTRDSTQTNLLRLNDIITEVETQMASPKRQASKADRFVRLSDELRDRRRSFWGRSFGKADGAAVRPGPGSEPLLGGETASRDRPEPPAIGAGTGGPASERTRILPHGPHPDHPREGLDPSGANRRSSGARSRSPVPKAALRQIAGDREDLRKRIAAEPKRSSASKRNSPAWSTPRPERGPPRKTSLSPSTKSVAGGHPGGRPAKPPPAGLRSGPGAGPPLLPELKRHEEELRRLGEREKRLEREGDSIAAREQALPGEPGCRNR